MTPSEVTWWTPMWKRILLMSFFVALAALGHYFGYTSMTAIGWMFAGYTWHQMFVSFGWTKPTPTPTLS